MRIKAMLWEKLEGEKVHCYLCSHHCKIKSGAFGICGMRENSDGELYTHAYGRLIATNVDPIEKKPLYHFLPGTFSYSIATIGCNFRCPFCQNWSISQVTAKEGERHGNDFTPEQVVKDALHAGCKSISYTYTEPTVFFEYAYATSKLAREKGLHNVFVTNGFMTKEATDTIAPYLDAANIDLKFFSERSYANICKARLAPVLDSIKYMKKLGIWVEVTTLVIPGENDSEQEFRSIAEFLAEAGRDIPWHISRFHPDYQYTDTPDTPLETMEAAYKAGEKAGLKYVYLGNVAEEGRTECPECGKLLVSRSYLSATIDKNFVGTGKCPGCGTGIEGKWKC